MIWLVSVANADCERSVSPDQLVDLASEAEAAFVEMSDTGISQAAQQLDAVLPCIVDAVRPREAAAVYRVRALLSFVDGEVAQAGVEYASVRRADPTWDLPLTVAPPTHPLRRAWERSDIGGELRMVELPAPEDGWLVVDGTRSGSAPGQMGYLLQHVGPDGRVRSTELVSIGGSPSYPTAAPPLPPPLPAESRFRFALSLGSMVWLQQDLPTGRALGMIEPMVGVRLGDRLSLDLRVPVGMGASSVGASILPVFHPGLAYQVSEGPTHPWVGAGGLLMVHDDLPTSVGGTLDFGIRPELGSRSIELTASLGYAAAPWLAFGAGIGF